MESTNRLKLCKQRKLEFDRLVLLLANRLCVRSKPYFIHFPLLVLPIFHDSISGTEFFHCNGLEQQ